jgi:hypothetical protein
VLVRYGMYGSAGVSLQLADGISLYGSCSFDGVDRKYRSTVLGLPAISANNVNTPTMIFGFVVTGADAAPGQASIAMAVSNSKGLTLSHDVLASGKGGNGSSGLSVNGGPGGEGFRAIGSIGGAGGKACPSNPPPGDTGAGGQGADYQQVFTRCFITCNCSNNNYPNSLGKQGKSSGNVQGGGGGGRGSSGCYCEDRAGGDSGKGQTGGTGNPGACSTTGGKPDANTLGSFRGTTWIPGRGDLGGTGQVGSGGGGGGSGGVGVDYAIPIRDFNGMPGGGGGGGGCGGPGGQGGQQGGASIPLVLLNSSIVAVPNTNVFIPGPGGSGGGGATGGTGGPGGGGHSGATGTRFRVTQGGFCSGLVPGYGGQGGDGGQGGAGGGGAGGNGGPSFAIALVNSPQLAAPGIAIYPALPGVGGHKGLGGQNNSSQCKGADGQAGVPGFSNNNNSIVSFTSAGEPLGGQQ